MKRSLVGIFIDNTILAVLIIVLSFLFFKQFISSTLICLACALLISIIFIFTIINMQSRKLNKLSLKTNELKKVDSCNIALRKMDKDSQVAFFLSMFENAIKISDSTIKIGSSTALSIKLDHDELESQDIFSAYQDCKNTSVDQINIVCNEVNIKSSKTASYFEKSIVFLTPIETYALLKNHNTFPTTFDSAPTKRSRFNLLKATFMRDKAKGFIKIGVLLFILSLFVPFSSYYIISASICTFLGVICLLFGKRKIEINDLSSRLMK